ncbi:MAG: MBL fold metallo-hydrolase [Methanotrichaceae archaeon]|nr:MBL fold metallo-hydrolase [Methanotrichaceae archaeon]
MKVTIIYDNTSFREDLKADWGFSALIEARGKRILFDTGARGDILFDNMSALAIDPRSIEEVFISHPHADHTGGLSDFLRINPVRVVIPISSPAPKGAEVLRVGEPREIHPGIYSTGELAGIEQSMVVDSGPGLVVLCGCAHPGVGVILDAASQFGEVKGLIGGLHGFSAFDRIKGLDLICPAHCTAHRSEIMRRFSESCLEGGAGRVIEIGKGIFCNRS